MSSLAHSLWRRNPRYRVKQDADVTVTIVTIDGSADAISAELVDISIGGAKFRTTAAIRAKKIVAIRIEVRDPHHAIEASGEVCWAAPMNEGFWCLGCAFKPNISEDMLQRFAEAGVLERRTRRREPVSLRATARWELKASETPVTILDYSAQGGFCLLSQSPGQPGSRVDLLVQQKHGETLIRGKTRWQSSSEEGYRIGCEFFDGRDAARFSVILNNGRPHQLRESRPRTLGWIPSIAVLTPFTKRRKVRRRISIAAVVSLVILLDSVLPSYRFSSIPEALSGDSDEASNQQSFGQLHNVTAQQQATSFVSLLPALPSQAELEYEPAFTVIELMEPRQDAMIRRPTSRAEPSAETTLNNLDSAPVIARSSEPNDARGRPGGLSEYPVDLPEAEAVHADTAGPSAGLNIVSIIDGIESPADETVRSPSGEDILTSESPPQDVADVEPSVADAEGQKSGQVLHETDPPASGPTDPHRALKHYRHGSRLYRQGEYELAAETLDSAVQAAPAEPCYLYVLAMAQFQLEQLGEAEQSVERAARLERDSPMPDWGKQMEGFQGPARTWLEAARRRARN